MVSWSPRKIREIGAVCCLAPLGLLVLTAIVRVHKLGHENKVMIFLGVMVFLSNLSAVGFPAALVDKAEECNTRVGDDTIAAMVMGAAGVAALVLGVLSMQRGLAAGGLILPFVVGILLAARAKEPLCK